MTTGEIILLAVALSVDSMAVSMSGSVSLGHLRWNKVLGTACILAFVQALFFVIGYFAGEAVSTLVEKWGRWIGFGLLTYIGVDMILEALQTRRGIVKERERDFSTFGRIILAAIATSIDAIAAGASFGITHVDMNQMWITDALTFIATVLFAVIGMVGGYAAGKKFGYAAKMAAGVVLICIGANLAL